MSLMLPPALSKFLNMIGLTWPEGDEDKIKAWADAWVAYGKEIAEIQRAADGARDKVSAANEGPGVEAFKTDYAAPGQVRDIGGNLVTAANVTSGSLLLVAATVVTLKGVFIAELTLLAYEVGVAIAAAPETAGASLAAIPIAEYLTEAAINLAINVAIEAVLG